MNPDAPPGEGLTQNAAAADPEPVGQVAAAATDVGMVRRGKARRGRARRTEGALRSVRFAVRLSLFSERLRVGAAGAEREEGQQCSVLSVREVQQNAMCVVQGLLQVRVQVG